MITHEEARKLLAIWSFREPTTAELQGLARYISQQESLSAKPLDGDVVERVAAAMYRTERDRFHGVLKTWDDLDDDLREKWRVRACAAVAAMPKDGRALGLAKRIRDEVKAMTFDHPSYADACELVKLLGGEEAP